MIEGLKERIECELETLLPPDPSFYPSLTEGGRYCVLAPAKRIRPLLTLLATLWIDPQAGEKALRPACALELVHTYSLIHDDLPSMDNDDFRRGRPTLHKISTEGHAILVGDWLLTYAFEIIATAPFLSPLQKVELVTILSQAAGRGGMIGGQVMDIEKSPHIKIMHQKKTGALFCAALQFGGVITSASPSQFTALRQFGELFGELFQVVDDLNDQDHPLGQEKGEETMKELYLKCLHVLKSFPGNSSLFTSILDQLVPTNIYG